MEDCTELNQLLQTCFELRGLKSYTVHHNSKGMSITIRFDNGGLDKCSTESTKMVRKSNNATRRDQKRMTDYNNSMKTRSQAKANGPEKQRDSDNHISLSETGHILSPEMLFSSPTQAEQPCLSYMSESPVGPTNTSSHDDMAECPDSPVQSVHDDSTVELPSPPSIQHDDYEQQLLSESKAQITDDLSDSVCTFFQNWTLNTPFLKEHPFLNNYSIEESCLHDLRYSKLLMVADDTQKHSLASHIAGGHQCHRLKCTVCWNHLRYKSEQTSEPDPDPPYKRTYYYCDDCQVYACGTCNPESLCPRQECRKSMTQIW